VKVDEIESLIEGFLEQLAGGVHSCNFPIDRVKNGLEINILDLFFK
jgi:hypothetical protein